MKNISVVVAGHQFGEPLMWVLYLSNRFKKQVSTEVLLEPDRSIFLEIQTDKYVILTKAPIHPLLNKEESYRILLTQHADVVIYVQSVFADFLYLIQRDFDIVSPLLAVRPIRPPVFTLLNDIYCGMSRHRTLLSAEELNRYRIPGSRVFRTAIGDLPAVGNCSMGANDVFDELLNVLNDMKK